MSIPRIAMLMALVGFPVCSRGELAVDVQAQGGEFKLYNTDDGDAENASGITVEMMSLMEVDADGNEVGQAVAERHSLSSFARTEFEIEDPEENVSTGTAKATRVRFTASVGMVGKVAVETFVITEAGVAGNGTEMWNVSEGDLKWNVIVPEWNFCDPCSAGATLEVGAFLDLTVIVIGLDVATTEDRNRSLDVDFGDSASLLLASMVQIDDEIVEMPEGYPRIELQGVQASLTFRFPKFNRKAIYDPIIELCIENDTMNDIDDGDDDDDYDEDYDVDVDDDDDDSDKGSEEADGKTDENEREDEAAMGRSLTVENETTTTSSEMTETTTEAGDTSSGAQLRTFSSTLIALAFSVLFRQGS